MTIALSPTEIGCLFVVVIMFSGFLGYVIGLKDQRIQELEERTKGK